MSFFKWYGGLQRKMLARFDHLFVQNESSNKLMDEIGLGNISSISGDTRFDRVIEIAAQWQPIPAIEEFIGNNKTVVAGSTWPEDEEVLQKAFAGINDSSLKLIIAPHEITEKHLELLEKIFVGPVRFSYLNTPNQQPVTSNILIIDNIGMLSKLYKYGYISYVGGGFRTMGVHNVLEAAVYGKPVITGPFYKKYAEAVGLIESGGGIVITNEKELVEQLNSSIDVISEKGKAAGEFVSDHAGATGKIIQYIQEKRLLTN
jgi:3-deoxy-D-manno-octulosonic-acid transferase